MGTTSTMQEGCLVSASKATMHVMIDVIQRCRGARGGGGARR